MSLIVPPSYPPAPESLEIVLVTASGMVRSPWTGQQQVFYWGYQWLEAQVQMPSMLASDFNNWFAFLTLLQGQTNTFQFSAAFTSAYPLLLESGSPLSAISWRLKANTIKYSLTHQRVFGLQYDLIQSI